MPKKKLRIDFDPRLWRQTQVGTLLKLIHDTAYDLKINTRINANDEVDLNKLINKYLPPKKRPAKLVKALRGAATAAKKFCDIKRNGTKDPKGLKKFEADYAKHVEVILEYLRKEFYAEDFSIIW